MSARPGRVWPSRTETDVLVRSLKTVHVTTIDLTAWCFLRTWFQTLRKEGHEVVLVTTPGPFSPRLREEGVRVVDIPIHRRISLLWDFVSVVRLALFFLRYRPDVVHTHTSKAGFVGRFAAWLTRVPLVLHTMHEPPHNAASGWMRRIYIGFERLASLWAHHVITVSYANEKEILARRLVPEEKLTVIREGLDLSRYPRLEDRREAIRRLGIADALPVVGMVGRLEAAKGHTYLLKAAQLLQARHPGVRIVIVGGGQLRSALEAEASALQVTGCVTFTGFRDDMLSLMQGFDIFTLPSLWEGLGIVLLEAMAYERPVVASRVGGVQDVVVPGETGLLVPARSPEALADAIGALLLDPARAAEMGRAGYQRLVRDFRDDVANERMLTLYREQVEARRIPT